MHWWQLLLIAVYILIIFVTIKLIRYFRSRSGRVPRLTPESPRYSGEDAPLVSVMIPVKDEENSIGDCLTSVLAFDYPNLEVLVMDDRSTDRTPEILASFAEQDSRVKIATKSELPEGWGGKNHALHELTGLASGEWFLYLDADTTHHPDLIRMMLEDCQQNGYQVASLIPRMIRNTFWEKVIQPFAGSVYFFHVPLHHVNDPKRLDVGFTNGQVLFISRSAYDEIGGHAAVRSHLSEDVQIGLLTKQKGLGLRVSMAPELSQVRMYASLGEMMRGWGRIFATTVKFDASKLTRTIVRLGFVSLLSYCVMLATLVAIACGWGNPFAYTMLALAVVHECLQFWLFQRIYAFAGFSDRWQVFRVLGTIMILIVLFRSIRVCKTREVQWKGTRYTPDFNHEVGSSAANANGSSGPSKSDPVQDVT